MFAMLGKTFFTLESGIDGLDSTSSVQFAEHAVFVGKPKIQAIAPNLDQYNISLSLHFQRGGSVKRRIDAISTMMKKQDPVPFVMGNGRFVGIFVIDEIQQTSVLHDDRGGLLAATLAVHLIEFAGELPTTSPLLGILGDALGALGVSQDTINLINDVVTTVESVITYANEVLDTVEQIKEVVNSLRHSSYPLADLAALTTVLGYGIGLTTQALDVVLPEGAAFSSFTSNMEKASSFMQNIDTVATTAINQSDVAPYIDEIEAHNNNLNTVNSLMNVDKNYMMAEIAGRKI